MAGVEQPQQADNRPLAASKSSPTDLHTRADVLHWLLLSHEEDAQWVLSSLCQERPGLIASVSKNAHVSAVAAGGTAPVAALVAAAVVAGSTAPDASSNSHGRHNLRQASGEAIPKVLWVMAPNQQAACAGPYELVHGAQVNQEPLWKQQRGDRWLFSGVAGRWGIGELYEKDLNFNCSGGFIQCEAAHNGKHPHKMTGACPWMQWNGQKWVKDPGIYIKSTPPPAPRFMHLSIPGELSACSGVYEIAAHLRPNGQPCWRRRGGGRWIFSGPNGQWIIGTESARKDGFMNSVGQLHGEHPHGGLLPDQTPGGWNRWDGKAWVSDPSIYIKSCQGPEDVDQIYEAQEKDEHLAPLVQFACALYMEDEDNGPVSVDVFRVGDLAKKTVVKYFTEDKSAEAGKNYYKAEGTITFQPEELLKSIQIDLMPNEDWSNTLAFELVLAEEGMENARLGRFQARTRVLVMNNDYFPTNTLFDNKVSPKDTGSTSSMSFSASLSRSGIHTRKSKVAVDAATGEDGTYLPQSLFKEYVKMNFRCNAVVRKGTQKMMVVDQLHNIYFFITLLIDVYLVDVVLKKDLESAIAELLSIAVIRILPFALLHYLDFAKLHWKVGGTSRATLQTSLFRRYVWFDRSSRISLKVGDLSAAVTRDAPIVVAHGYASAIKLPGCFGKLLLMLVFQVSSPIIFKKDIDVGVMFLESSCLMLYPLLLMGFLACRQKKVQAAMMGENKGSKAVLECIQQTVSHCHAIQEYQMHGTAIDEMAAHIGKYNGCLVGVDTTICNNLYFSKWLTLIFVVTYMAIGGVRVVTDTVSVGMFLAMTKIYTQTGNEWGVIYDLLLKIQMTFPALGLITRYLNHPCELRAARQHWEATLSETKRKFEELKDIDEVPLRIANINVKYDLKMVAQPTDCDKMLRKVKSFNMKGAIEMKQGTLVTIMGPHGNGKATMLRTLGGLLIPNDLNSVFVPSHLQVLTVSFTPQFFRGTMLGNLLYGSGMKEDAVTPDVKKRIQAICDRLHLGEEVHEWIQNNVQVEAWSTLLSQSQAHLLNIARGLIADPDVLCVHYPRAILSESVANEVWWALRDFVSSRGLERDSDPTSAPWHRRRPRTCIASGLTGGGCMWGSHPDQIIEVNDGQLKEV